MSVDKAIAFATKAHEGQFRKGTSRPYIVHPIEVCDIVASMTRDEDIISAAVLHDTIEDCPQITEEILAEEFGERVASIVAQESEDKSKTWRERKGNTIEHLKTAPKEVQMVALADKLSKQRGVHVRYAMFPRTGHAFDNHLKDIGIAVRDYVADVMAKKQKRNVRNKPKKADS